MSVYSYGASTAQDLARDVEPSAITTTMADSPQSAGSLASEDCTTNGWVDSLLRQSLDETFRIGPVKLESARRLIHYNGRTAHFSPIDFALLLVLARQNNRIMSYSRIYRRLWGPTSKVSVPRLRVHIFRVRKRLDDELMSGIRIVNRGGMGYLMEFAGHAPRESTRDEQLERGHDSRRKLRIPHSPAMNDREDAYMAAE